MAECFACWFFAGRLRLPVRPGPPGRKGGTLDLAVRLPDGTQVFAEVKAPHLPIPRRGHRYGDESEALRDKLEAANGQFHQGVANLLVIVPTIYMSRGSLTRAFLVEPQLVAPFDGSQVSGPFTFHQAQSGRFLRPGKGNRLPAFTRVSGVLSLEEAFEERFRASPPTGWYEPRALLLHNPNAAVPLPAVDWPFPELVKLGNGYMAWDDGANPWI